MIDVEGVHREELLRKAERWLRRYLALEVRREFWDPGAPGDERPRAALGALVAAGPPSPVPFAAWRYSSVRL